ncbi:MAG: hypothetical protein IH614_12680 [Desulfuromonadales bacterium]|nr:hypothetical protein [Desulfuromonadales bacterium]
MKLVVCGPCREKVSENLTISGRNRRFSKLTRHSKELQLWNNLCCVFSRINIH